MVKDICNVSSQPPFIQDSTHFLHTSNSIVTVMRKFANISQLRAGYHTLHDTEFLHQHGVKSILQRFHQYCNIYNMYLFPSLYQVMRLYFSNTEGSTEQLSGHKFTCRNISFLTFKRDGTKDVLKLYYWLLGCVRLVVVNLCKQCSNCVM